MTEGRREPLDRSLLRSPARQDHPAAAGRRRWQRACTRYRLDLAAPAPADLQDAVSRRRSSDVRLEIGFGGGEHLLHDAPAIPATGFIGVEPFVNGMAKMMTALAEKPLGQSPRL